MMTCTGRKDDEEMGSCRLLLSRGILLSLSLSSRAFPPFQVHFTTTLFALIRDNLKINVRESSEMDQADIELRTTIIKCWPHTKRDKIDLLVPTHKREDI